MLMRTCRLAALVIAAATTAVGRPADAQTPSGFASADLTSEQTSVNKTISQTVERLDMLVKSSRILTLESRIPRFQVHNESVLTATPISENQIQIFAKTAGTTQINLWDTDDTLYTVDVMVSPDAREVEAILSSQLPFANLKVLPVNGSAIVSGSVTSVDDVDRAVAITEQFYTTIVNNIQVVGVQQVLLHTRIMEVSRTKLRDLGIDWGYYSDSGNVFLSSPSSFVDIPASGEVLTATGAGTLGATNGIVADGATFRSFIRALREQKLIKFLAEPTVVATHGRPARFNVGGRVPYLVPGGNGTVQVRYEEYGTAVDFLPFVVGPGRVRLEVRPEVTEPDESRGLNANGIAVTAFSQRYVETAIELQAGQTFAIAGLLQSRTEANSNATPLLGELPFIGAAFRRVRHQRNDIELLITVTPELVAGMDAEQVPPGGPGLNSMTPTDSELYGHGFLEVPNLKAQDCNCGVSAHGGAACGPGAPIAQGEMNYIVPGSSPTVVAEGVSISTPPPVETYFSAPGQSPAMGQPATGFGHETGIIVD